MLARAVRGVMLARVVRGAMRARTVRGAMLAGAVRGVMLARAVRGAVLSRPVRSVGPQRHAYGAFEGPHSRSRDGSEGGARTGTHRGTIIALAPRP
jgi:hypothetical protein